MMWMISPGIPKYPGRPSGTVEGAIQNNSIYKQNIKSTVQQLISTWSRYVDWASSIHITMQQMRLRWMETSEAYSIPLQTDCLLYDKSENWPFVITVYTHTHTPLSTVIQKQTNLAWTRTHNYNFEHAQQNNSITTNPGSHRYQI